MITHLLTCISFHVISCIQTLSCVVACFAYLCRLIIYRVDYRYGKVGYSVPDINYQNLLFNNHCLTANQLLHTLCLVVKD